MWTASLRTYTIRIAAVQSTAQVRPFKLVGSNVAAFFTVIGPRVCWAIEEDSFLKKEMTLPLFRFICRLAPYTSIT
jgi:hypothetical protein